MPAVIPGRVGCWGRVVAWLAATILVTGLESSRGDARAAADPREEVQLPNGCDAVYQVLAPDGRCVAYIGGYTPEGGTKQYGMFVVDRATGQVRRMLENAVKTAPAWSPDSKRLAIGDSPGYGNVYPLVIVDADTGAVEKTGVQGVGAAWSPDGRRIAVSSEFHQAGSWRGGIPADGRIAVYDVAAKTLTPVSPPGFNVRDDRSGRSAMGGALHPIWSTDGRWIAFERYATVWRDKSIGEVSQVWVVAPDGQGLRKVLEPAQPVRWSADGHSLIAEPTRSEPTRTVSIDAIAPAEPGAWSQPPDDLLAAERRVREAGERARRFDPAPIFRRNQPWQSPRFDHLQSVQFTHRMEPTRLDEHFAWRRDGAMVLEVVHREDAKARDEIGRTWITAPGGDQYYFAPGARYPRRDRGDEDAALAYARDHLMGTRLRFNALDWGRDLTAFNLRDAQPGADGRTIVVEIAPNPDRRDRRDRPALHAGAMFETTSWAYVHDLAVAWSELVVDARTHRILRETDHDHAGAVVCEVTLSDWLDVDPAHEQSVPQRVQFHFPGQKFTVDDSFRWLSEGLWMLDDGLAQFAEGDHQPQRQTIADLAVNAPIPALDAQLERARLGWDELEAPGIAAESRTLPLYPYRLGRRLPIAPEDNAPGGPASPIAACLFTVRDTITPTLGSQSAPTLRAVIDLFADRAARPPGSRLFLALLDDHGRPLHAAQGPLDDARDRVEIDLGRSPLLPEARSWIIAPTSDAGARRIDVAALPARLDDRLVVQVTARHDGTTRVRSIRLARDVAGAIVADVEVVSRNHWKALLTGVFALLLDADDTVIAAASGAETFRVEQELRDRTITLHFGRPIGDKTPCRIVLGFDAIVAGAPMGSSWGQFMIYHGPASVTGLLDADDPELWRRGLTTLEVQVRRELPNPGLEGSSASRRAQRAFVQIRQAIGPHRDRMEALLRQTDDPIGLVLLCRLAGYSGDARFIAPLRRRLDDPRVTVRDAACIGLGLLGVDDANITDRLRALRDRPPPDDPADRREAEDWKTDAIRALDTLTARAATGPR